METTLQCSTGNNLERAEDRRLAESNSRVHNATEKSRSELPALFSSPIRQPVSDVAQYLAQRKPCALPERENELFITLPTTERANVTELLAAFRRVTERLKLWSVTRACEDVLRQPRFWQHGWNAKTFRALYDAYTKQKDWVCLVNRSKCPVAWRKTSVGLPPAFLKFCATRFSQFRRDDAKRQAVLAIKRQWRTGRNPDGQEEVIPGYEAGWNSRVRELIPKGWHYSNITRQIKKTGRFTKSVRALAHEGHAAAKALLPKILRTRAELRFLEEVTFDDVRTDWLIFNPTTGKPEELWLLVARDTATAMVLGFVMHPASERPDGTATHLGLKQMKQLAGWLLERYPLPPYVVKWIVERGTATLSQGVAMALGELLGNRIEVHFTSMIGGSSPVGYREKAKGNSTGKAGHESDNRLFHTQGSYIAGQTGSRWDIRPADLIARGEEAVEIWALRDKLPEYLRNQVEVPLLTLNQAREHLTRICHEKNLRDDHKLEGFNEVLEWFDPQAGQWQPQNTFPGGDVKIRKRMERPYERALRLMQGLEWTPISPAIITAFYEHSEKAVTVQDSGEISFSVDGRKFVYRNGGVPLVPGTKALAYFHEDEPRFIYLTDGKGTILGTWIRRDRISDREALEDAFRYTALAKRAVADAAKELAAPERAALAAMRAHNEQLMQLAEFTDITEAPTACSGTVGAPMGAALIAVSAANKADLKRTKKQATSEAVAAAADIFKVADAADEETQPDTSAASELLAAFRNQS